MLYRSIRTRALPALALCILSISTAAANVQTVDFIPDHLLDTPSESIPVDVDSNGVTDFIFYYDLYQGSPFLHVNVPDALQSTNQVIVNGAKNIYGKDQILPLDSGAVVSAASLFNGPISGNGPLFAQPESAGGDMLEGRGLNYIGFRFSSNGSTHYGWFRLSVDTAGSIATIDAYGWEKEPEMPLTIGDPGRIRVESIRVAGYSGVTGIATPGGTLLMIATVLPENATNKAVRWFVSDTSLATIDTFGMLHARRNGMVTVTAESVDNIGITGSAVITISGQPTSSVRIAGQARAIGTVSMLPDGNTLQIELAESGRSSATLVIADITGRTMLASTLDEGNAHRLDCSTLGNGTYLVLCRTEKGTVSGKIVIVR